MSKRLRIIRDGVAVPRPKLLPKKLRRKLLPRELQKKLPRRTH